MKKNNLDKKYIGIKQLFTQYLLKYHFQLREQEALTKALGSMTLQPIVIFERIKTMNRTQPELTQYTK